MSCRKSGRSSWPPTARTPGFIEELFTGTDTTDFMGSVRCAVPHGRLFTGVAVELDTGNRIFTTPAGGAGSLTQRRRLSCRPERRFPTADQEGLEGTESPLREAS